VSGARLVVFGYGNPSRGDDAIGPLLVERLTALQAARPDWPAVELLTDFQLQVEHAVDLQGRELALFIDAHMACAAPFVFSRLEAARDVSYTTHAMTPAALLYAYAQVYRQPPPPAFLLSVRGEHFELGDPLSPAAETHLDAAARLLEKLCMQPDGPAWQQYRSR